ncbi:MAG: hypothetical protein ABI577_17910, partial [bacterium]
MGDRGFDSGATAPAKIERLGMEPYDGAVAWKLRYRYLSGSIEGAYPVEVTEWIAADDYRLLRAEREVFDPFGLVGQLVMAARSFGTSTSCPSPPEMPVAKLVPMTSPRLENP